VVRGVPPEGLYAEAARRARAYVRRKGLAGRALAVACLGYRDNFLNASCNCYCEHAREIGDTALFDAARRANFQDRE
jgi:hypothetical protein